ncbi:unnamed protein product [Linum trigynum]|uniref:Retrotransposon gag domain-containing protein n=1 Tax=Linum trigynum TaxID=586398 RepID=A0AAV2G4U4_9ROSI
MPPKKNTVASQDVGDDDGSGQAGRELAEMRARDEALDRRLRATEEELGLIKSTTGNLERGQTTLQVVVEEIRSGSQAGYETLARRQTEADAKLDRITSGQGELRASNEGIQAMIAQLAEMIAGMGNREPARRTVDLIPAVDKLKGALTVTEEERGSSSPLPVTPHTTLPRGVQGGELLKTRDHAIQALGGAWGSLAMDTGDYRPPSGLPTGMGGGRSGSAGGTGTGASGSGPRRPEQDGPRELGGFGAGATGRGRTTGWGSSEGGLNREAKKPGEGDRVELGEPNRGAVGPGRSEARGEAAAALFKGRQTTIEFPRFTRHEDPSGWMSRVEKYFKYQGISEEQKVVLASFHLEGDANQWVMWLEEEFEQSGKEMWWEDFRDEFWKRYGASEKAAGHEALAKIKQTGTVEDYQQTFEKLLNRCRGWGKEAIMGTYMGGLKPEISAYIHAFNPQNTEDA